MNRHLFTLAFVLGAAAIVWVGVGFFGTHLLALLMTLLIAVVYGLGALELRQFRQASARLSAALANIAPSLTHLGDWLNRVPPALQNAVRLRVEGERMGLPGPALTPYLVGLLVMLGMLGTFLGMVVTLNGAAFSLEGTADLQAIRAALAAPIKGLGLAFGTSVAGVAASAMLGLMSALSRRERMLVAQQLDTHIATSLRAFSHSQQRQEAYKALQTQAQALPAVASQLQDMMTQMSRMNLQLNERLLSNQDGFHTEVKGMYRELAASVDQSLKDSLTQSTQVAGDSLKPILEAALTGLARDARALQSQVTDTAHRQLTSLNERFDDHMAAVLARDNQLLAERSRVLASVNSLMRGIEQSTTEQRAVIEALVASSRQALDTASHQFAQHIGNEKATLADVAAQVTGSAVEVSSLGETLGFAVNTFTESNEKLIGNLQRIEAAMDKSMARSDDQLAYFVAQAREIIDLSVMSQKEIFEELRQLPSRQAALAEEAR